jgi:hypothetical protein
MGIFDRILGKEKEEPKKPDLFQVKKVGGYEHIPFRSPKYRIVLELLVPMVAVQGNALQELIEIKKEH